MTEPRNIREFTAFDSPVPEIGVLLGAMQETRAGLLSTLDRVARADGFGQEFLDWRGPGGDDNSVGALLYHIAAVELGWLYIDILGGDMPAELDDFLPVRPWDEDERLAQMAGVPLRRHLEVLAEARRRFLDVVGPMTREEWKQLRSSPGEDYSMTAEWVVFHLVEHEAGHLYQIHRLVRHWLARSG